MATTKRLLALTGYGLLTLAAAAGVILAVAFLVVTTPLAGLVVPRALPLVNGAIAGRVEVASVRVLPRGGLELRGVRVLDPEGQQVLSAERLRVELDLARLRRQTLGFQVEADALDVLLQQDARGELSIARAFEPRHPTPREPSGPFTWTLRVPRLTVRRAAVRQLDADGRVRWAVQGIDADGRGIYAPGRAAVDLSVRAALTAPEQVPLALEVAAGLRGRQARVRALRLTAGDTALEAVGELDLASWKGRVALLALKVDAAQVGRLAPPPRLASDLAGTLYAESDGAVANLALDLTARGGGGRATAAAAARLPPGELAVGAELHLVGLDLARVLRGAPPSALNLDATLRAQGGLGLAQLVGAARVELAPSRLRGGTVGPVELRASADRGAFTVSRLSLRAPGLVLDGEGRWQPKGAIAGTFTLEASDLAAARENLVALLDRPLPAVTGRATLGATLSGTEATPELSARLSAPRLAAEGIRVSEAVLALTAKGPLERPSGEVQGQIAEVARGTDALRAVRLHASVSGREGEVSLRGAVPQLGPDAVTLEGQGALSPDGHLLTLSRLALAWPEARFELVRPAHLELVGPSVDRLELVGAAPGGPARQRLVLSGGMRRRRGAALLDARVEVAALELGSVPKALIPQRLGLAGRLSADVSAAGAPGAPDVAVRLDLADASLLGLGGLSLGGDARYDGSRRRARFDLSLSRREGGEVTLRGDVPVALARAPRASPVTLDLAVKGVRVAEALRLAKAPSSVAVDGLASLEVHLSGTTGAPALRASATLSDATAAGLDGLAVAVAAEDPGHELRLTGTLDRARSRALDLEVRAPLELAALLRTPAPVARALAAAPLQVKAEVPGLELTTLAGRFGIPADVEGTFTGQAELTGTARAPRGKVSLALAKGAVAGYRELAGALALEARPDSTAVTGEASVGGIPLLRLTGSLALPPEALAERGALETAQLVGRLEIPDADLRRAGASLPLAGLVSGEAVAKGSLAEPSLSADFRGKGLMVSDHPLGDLSVKASAEGHLAHAELHLAVASGGVLDGELRVEAAEGLRALRVGDVKKARARADVRAKELDLGVLPALAPGLVRTASGKLTAELTAAGPLGALRPRGSASLEKGQVAVTEWGNWTDLVLHASLTEDALHLDQLSARRGQGTLELKAQMVGLSRTDAPAELKGSLRTVRLAIPKGGQVLATVDLDATATGSYGPGRLDAEVRVGSAVVKLPEKLPRKVQALEGREDIVVWSFARPRAKVNQSVTGPVESPFHATVHLLAPSRCQIKGDSPTVDVDLRADVTADWRTGAPLALSGNVLTQRGRLEVYGRSFEVKRGRVDFTGAGFETADLDVQALYDNPQAKVTVAVGGTVAKPEVKLTSEPPLDESQIAFLLATGRTELKPGAGGVSSGLDAGTLGQTAMGALSGFFVKDVLGDKLPVDTVEASSSRIRAGKYLSDKAYVGYTRNLTAKSELGENTNEVSLQYQIARHWNFEARVGDAGSGGASLIWSKDY